MTTEQYIEHARSYGYEIRYTNIGMAFIALGDVMLTEVKDVPEIEKELSLIGMAIINDIVRTLPAEDFHESDAEEDEDLDELDLQEDDFELSPEDYAEWCAASCGMTYNAYIGKPWLD